MNTSLMSYIGSNPTQGARKYTGSAATGYDAKREESPKWKAEQAIIEDIIDGMPKGATILDIPVGTGRFIAAYQRNNHCFHGIDLSEDMLRQAEEKVTEYANHPQLKLGDVTELDRIHIPDVHFNLSIMCRLTRWLNPEQRVAALKQLQRVTTHMVVFTARVANHPHAYPLEDIEAALEPGWHIQDNFEAGEPDYRVIVLGRKP